MLENWVWEKPALQRMSGRLSDGAPLPDELIAKLTNSRRANAGVIYKRQLLFALYDQALHAGKQVDVNELYKTMCKEVRSGWAVFFSLRPTRFTLQLLLLFLPLSKDLRLECDRGHQFPG